MEHRAFERLVAELFDGFGYDVELTKRTRDGGKDIIAVKKREVDVRLLIECRRPDAGKHVPVHFVRELLGVKVHERATKGILATTSYFTKDAKELFDQHRWELEPRDRDGIREWMEMYLRLK